MAPTFSKPSPDDWEAKIIKELKGKPLDTVMSHTQDGKEIRPFYTKEDRVGMRGLHSLAAWVCRQDFWGKDDKELNGLIKEALEASAASIGVDLDEEHDLETLFADIQVEILQLHLKSEEPLGHIEALEGLLARANKTLEDLSGSWDHDPIGEALERGGWKDCALQDCASIWKLMEIHGKDFGLISIRGDRFHNAGASSEKELLYSLATAKAYLDTAIDGGVDVRALASHIRFQITTGTDFLESVVKIMALRILWANILKAYGCSPGAVQITARSSGWDLSPVDADTNLLRSSTQALAAIVGGCDDLVLQPHDGECNAFSMRMSRNIQHLLKHESYLDKFQNPIEGAYAFETLATGLCETVWKGLKEIDEKGGWLLQVAEGDPQKDMLKSGKMRAEELLNGERPWLGVNLYPVKEGSKLEAIAWTEPPANEIQGLTFPIFKVI